jgi:hypothetical protein
MELHTFKCGSEKPEFFGSWPRISVASETSSIAIERAQAGDN